MSAAHKHGGLEFQTRDLEFMGRAPLIQPERNSVPYLNYSPNANVDSSLDLSNDGAQSRRTVGDTYTPGFGSTNLQSFVPIDRIDPQIFSQIGSLTGEELYDGYDCDVVGSQPSDVHSERASSFLNDFTSLSPYTSSFPATTSQPSTTNQPRLRAAPPKMHSRSVSTGNLRLTTEDNRTRVELIVCNVCNICGTKLKNKSGLM